jgi:hypothetical protein
MAKYLKHYNSAGECDSLIDENGNWFPARDIPEAGNEFTEPEIQQQEIPDPPNTTGDIPDWAIIKE